MRDERGLTHSNGPMRRRTRRLSTMAAILVAVFLSGPYSLCSADTLGSTLASTEANPVVRIKDITRVQGVRDNQLVGLGLVVGLEGTGDGSSSQANIQMVTNMLQQFGVAVNPTYLRTRNVAAVMVTATLPPFSRSGSVIDVTVASMGDARSLQGGILLQTPLQAADGEVYAVAQGALAIGGQSAPSGRAIKTPALTAVMPGGAIVEKEVPASFVENNTITLLLNTPDFSTASRIAQSINSALGPGTAKATDKTAIQVAVPPSAAGNSVDFLAAVEELPVSPDALARVVVNERTGTVIIGSAVKVAPVAVTHGSLTVRIGSDWTQPKGANSIATGQIAVLGGSSVEDIVKGLNAIGATPKDIIAILQALKAAGALYAELAVM